VNIYSALHIGIYMFIYKCKFATCSHTKLSFDNLSGCLYDTLNNEQFGDNT